MNPVASALHDVHARYAPVDDRVQDILERIRRDCRELDPKARNEGNERQVEEFIGALKARFPGRCFEAARPSGAEDRRAWEAARRIPAWIDNGYRHENRADTLGSLRRITTL